jgi:hypothetical protein
MWEKLMERNLRLKSPAGLLSAWSMLRGVMLRRTKRHVEGELQLPQCTWEDRQVRLLVIMSDANNQQDLVFVSPIFIFFLC